MCSFQPQLAKHYIGIRKNAQEFFCNRRLALGREKASAFRNTPALKQNKSPACYLNGQDIAQLLLAGQHHHAVPYIAHLQHVAEEFREVAVAVLMKEPFADQKKIRREHGTKFPPGFAANLRSDKNLI